MPAEGCRKLRCARFLPAGGNVIAVFEHEGMVVAARLTGCRELEEFFLTLSANMSLTSHSRLRWSLLILLAVACTGAARTDEAVYTGEAKDEKGALVYTEKHRVSSADGRTTGSVTEYRAPDGALIATMRSDYSRSVAMPTYVFEDLRRNYREGLRWQEGQYVIFHQDGTAPEKTSRLGSGGSAFSCQGWHYYLVNNLDLLEKDNITLNLVLPSELRPFPFVVKKISSDGSRVSVELKLTHWLFRLFAPKMRLIYDKQKRHLVEFRGVSNILNQAGERQEVSIRYQYDAK